MKYSSALAVWPESSVSNSLVSLSAAGGLKGKCHEANLNIWQVVFDPTEPLVDPTTGATILIVTSTFVTNYEATRVGDDQPPNSFW